MLEIRKVFSAASSPEKREIVDINPSSKPRDRKLMIRKMIRKMMRKMTNNRGFQELGETGQGVSRGTSEILVMKCLKV